MTCAIIYLRGARWIPLSKRARPHSAVRPGLSVGGQRSQCLVGLSALDAVSIDDADMRLFHREFVYVPTRAPLIEPSRCASSKISLCSKPSVLGSVR